MTKHESYVKSVAFSADRSAESVAVAFDGSDRDDLTLDLAEQLAAATAEIERLRADVSACMSLVNIHDECRNSAERECDRLRAQTREACSIAEWALSVVCGDIPMFRNGETRTKRAALATIRHDAGLEGE